MSKKKTQAKRSPLWRVLRSLYIILFALSLLVVASYIALKLYAPPPDVADKVELPLYTDSLPGPEQSDNAASGTDTPDAADTDKPETVVLHRREGVYTCLLLGVADLGGSDTIMLGVFDTGAKTASLISIPRDTVVKYNGANMKINAAYSKGGVEAVRQCVSDMLAVQIDFYVSVNTRAFREIVDKINGVYFNVPVRMDYEDPYGDLYIHIDPGYQLLNGRQAEGVVRCRNCYANADIGRAATQRAFVAALLKQTVTLSNVTKVTDLINILNTYVESDMTLSNMVYFGTQAVGMNLDTDMVSAVLSDNWVSPYIVPKEEEVLALVNSLGVYEEQVPAGVLRLVRP